MIDDPRLCTADVFDLDALACADGQTEGCLTEGQIATARGHYEDLTNAAGEVVSPGVPPGAEAAGDWAFWMSPSDLTGGVSPIDSMDDMLALLMRFEADFNIDEYDPAEDRAQIAEATTPLDVRSGDLSEFRDRGGKLLMYQGWNDYPLRPQRGHRLLGKGGECHWRRRGHQRVHAPVHGAGHDPLRRRAGDRGRPTTSSPWWLGGRRARPRSASSANSPARLPSTTWRRTPEPSSRIASPGPYAPIPNTPSTGGEGDQNDERNFDCVSP